ncbi:MAG: putative porin [Verrucomicrobiales bacterium]|nr:putative porin [Verrucomicrobiales bacterium]
MKKLKKSKASTKIALFAGATALMALTNQSHAQSSDALIDKLVDKGILTTKEAQELRDEADKGFTTAFQAKTGTPDWVTAYKFSGDFRGRYDEVASTDSNPNFNQRNRFRYRLRAGLVVSMQGGLETGFSLTTADPAKGNEFNNAGNPLSGNSTMQDNGTKTGIYIDTAYGKWTPLNSDGWFLSTIIGKMINPLQFTPMVFDPDWTPEGAALQAGYTLNDQHSIMVTGVAFVEDQEVNGNDIGSVRAPGLFGGQAAWAANWTQKLATSLGLGGYTLINPQNLTTANVPYINQGNTRVFSVTPLPNGSYVLANNYSPIVADASATYKLDSFPLYTGAFPIKVAAEYINNVANMQNNDHNQGYWLGVTFGKSGTKGTWDISYRYEYLEADATYDQLTDDDNGAYYQNAPTGGAVGYFGGTNVKGHLIKANYSFTDSLTLTFSCFLNELITPGLNTAGLGEPKNSAMHVMADLMWKF